MDIVAEFGALIRTESLFDVEKKICSSILNLSQCHILPRYDAELFTEEFFPELVTELKRRNASLNGTLNDVQVRSSDDTLIITLQHGGKDILLQKGIDKKLSALIKEMLMQL